MAMGFLSSFTTLYHAAQQHDWSYPWLLPLSVDSGILAYVLLDHLAVTLGSRSRWLHLAAWSLAAFTVWANAAVGTNEASEWRVIHAAMPALWVLGVEALRFTWKRLHEDAAERPDRIPAGRWLAAPFATMAMRRRMWLAAETSYPRAVAMEDARLHARDLIRAESEKDGPPVIPDSLVRAVRRGRLPAAVVTAVDSGLRFGGASQWEPAVEEWVTGALTQSVRMTVRMESARREIERQAQPSPEPANDGQADRQPAPRKTVSAAVRTRRKVTRILTDSPGMPVKEVAAKAKVSESTVARIKREMPVPIRSAAK